MMPNRFSISNFKLLSNAGFWALLIIGCLELSFQILWPKYFHGHEVDLLTRKLNQKKFDAPVLVLGDSVAENVFRRMVRQENRFAVFASNQAIETTGQYFMLKRYLKQNPAPGVVVLMAGMPLYGDLEQIFTENYIQRVFLNGDEMAWMASHTLDPVFISKCIAYKVSPTFRYRKQLQNLLTATPPQAFSPGNYVAPTPPTWSAAYRLNQWWKKQRGTTASEKALAEILALSQRQDVPLIFIPPPGTSEAQPMIEESLAGMMGYQQTWPHLQVWEDAHQIFPQSYFFDGTHFNPLGYEKIRPYQQKLFMRILAEGNRQEQNRRNLSRLTVEDLRIRKWLELPSPFTLEDVYAMEGRRSKAFQWTHPDFSIQLNSPGVLILETDEISPPGKLTIREGSPLHAIPLDGGRQVIEIPLSPGSDRLRFSFPAWTPEAPHPRELGIAIQALGWHP